MSQLRAYGPALHSVAVATPALAPSLRGDSGVLRRKRMAVDAMGLSAVRGVSTDVVEQRLRQQMGPGIHARMIAAGEVADRQRFTGGGVVRPLVIQQEPSHPVRQDDAVGTVIAASVEEAISVPPGLPGPDPARPGLRMQDRNRTIAVDARPEPLLFGGIPPVAACVQIAQVVLIAATARTHRRLAVDLDTLARHLPRVAAGLIAGQAYQRGRDSHR
jgi:hypothetical protein